MADSGRAATAAARRAEEVFGHGTKKTYTSYVCQAGSAVWVATEQNGVAMSNSFHGEMVAVTPPHDVILVHAVAQNVTGQSYASEAVVLGGHLGHGHRVVAVFFPGVAERPWQCPGLHKPQSLG